MESTPYLQVKRSWRPRARNGEATWQRATTNYCDSRLRRVGSTTTTVQPIKPVSDDFLFVCFYEYFSRRGAFLIGGILLVLWTVSCTPTNCLASLVRCWHVFLPPPSACAIHPTSNAFLITPPADPRSPIPAIGCTCGHAPSCGKSFLQAVVAQGGSGGFQVRIRVQARPQLLQQLNFFVGVSGTVRALTPRSQRDGGKSGERRGGGGGVLL